MDEINPFPGFAQVSKLLSEMFHSLVPESTPSDQFDAKLNYADDLRRRMWEAIVAYRDEHAKFERDMLRLKR
jgi:hypothetical protein